MTDDVDALFDLPAAEFVAARDDLVKRLKADGATEQAAAVKVLRRPTLAAWAVNQAVRADPDAYEALVAAGRTVQKAQRRALSGVRDSGLRDASTARRGLVETLADHATRVLSDARARPESHMEDVVATFEAASADPDAATTIGAARLSAPVQVTTDFSGTSALLAMSVATAEEGDDDAEDVAPELAERRREAIRVLESARCRATTSAAAAQAVREEARALAAESVEAKRAADDARAAAEETATAATTDAEQDAEAVEAARADLEALD